MMVMVEVAARENLAPAPFPAFRETFVSFPRARFSTTRRVQHGHPDKCCLTHKFSFPHLS